MCQPVPSSTVVDASELSAVTPPSIELQLPTYDVSSSARRNEDGLPTLSTGGDQCGGGASLASALHFICCRCRRPMVVHPGMHHSAALASFSDKPQGRTPLGVCPTPAVQTAVGNPAATCGVGPAPDILDPPITDPGRDYRLARHEDDGDALARVPATVTSTDASEGFEGLTSSMVTNITDEALLKALPPYFFESAELLSLSQLSDLLSAAQGSSMDVTPATFLAEHASMGNRPPTSLPPPHSLSIAAPYSEAAATPAVPVVLDVSQLVFLGVSVRSSTNRDSRGAKDEPDVFDEGETPGVAALLAHESISTTAADGYSQRHATAPDKYSGESSVTELRTRPSRGAPSVGTLPLPPTLSSHAEGGVGEKSATRSCNAADFPSASLSHPPRADDSCADPPLLYKSISLSATLSPPPPPQQQQQRPAPSLTPPPEQGIVAAAPADELLETLPLDELCRRWMRLVAQTAEPHEQPVCMSCWRGTYTVPLQQRTQLALEGTNALSSMASGTREEINRFFTMCYTDPTTTQLRGAVVTPGSLLRGPSDAERRPAMDSKVAAGNLPRILPHVSLDAVAANLFGPNEENLLNSLDALSAPHRGIFRPLQGSLVAPGPSQCLSAPSLEPHKAPEAGCDVNTSTLSSCSHETQQLAAELENLQEQQASLDRRAAELREVLHALESTAESRSPSEGQCGDAAAVRPATGAPLEGWQRLAVDHNIREVQCAFTVGDKEAERKKSLADLVTRLAFVSATPIDALCFPIDVSGPVGLIAGLRLGLVPPYSGSSSSHGGSADGDVRGSGASAAFGLSAPPLSAHGPGPLSDEGIHLNLFVHRQVSYAQLLLSGNTSAAGEDPTNSGPRGSVSKAIRRADDSPWGGDGTAVSTAAAVAAAATATAAVPLAEPRANTRVSPGEVNAACGYLLQLINYLARVNGFYFQTAILRPAGDRSTLTLLKRVPASSSAAAAGGGRGEALLTTAASFSPLSLWSYLTRGDNVQAQSSGGGRVAPMQKATSAFVWVEDHDVDFYMTDRFLAWRTFGTACVAVAACVKELADALHESLRCWQVREGLMDQRATSTSLRMSFPASPVASSDAAERREVANSLPTPSADGAEVNDTVNETEAQGNTDLCLVLDPCGVPRSLPQLLQGISSQVEALHVEDDRVKGSETHRSSCADDTREKSAATSAKQGHHVKKSASAPANRGLSLGATAPSCHLLRSPSKERDRFPIVPPYQTRGDTVDGFSVRHGNVSEAIWTLGMKKLLANVQWCMEATLELERLYALH